ncbi:MAG: hypothetical protein HOP10_15790 [Chitinophagaceae bacterium]|nr:hypothetical protein [Chitinophagaceae bacterium]
MATGNNIKNFTAADIEKYHKGLLSKKEMHDLEKAALDDPFIADALEGYAVAGSTAQSHLADLRTRLSQKVEGARVVLLNERKRKAIPWLRIAAFVIVVAGATVLANQFIFKSNRKEDIAKVEKETGTEVKSPVTTDNTVATTPETIDEVTSSIKNDGPAKGTTPATHETLGEVTANSQVDNTISTEDVAVKTAPVTVTTNPGGIITNPPATGGIDDKAKLADRDLAKEKAKNVAAPVRKLDTDGDVVKDRFDVATVPNQQKKIEAVTANRRTANDETNRGYTQSNTNTFRGLVTDANNVGLPFARVTNAQDNNAGTYTDARGNFTLTYPDSVLDVQVRSIGFENRSMQLRNNVSNNQVILQDDRSLAAQTLPMPNTDSARMRMMTKVKLEEPEPADGWENYDTYLANNLNAPEEIRTKQKSGGQVQVSFEVNKEGEPINIKIEKSLCSKCDEEAKRLVKEGPKWKRNAKKKGRTTVTINF